MTCQCGSKQLISDPSHILESSLSFIDLIVMLPPNLVINSGICSSPHPNCHHQITHAKFNFDWKRAFSNKDVNKQTSVFNEAILNIIMAILFPMKTRFLTIGNIVG